MAQHGQVLRLRTRRVDGKAIVGPSSQCALCHEYLRVHQVAPSTIEKLRWPLSKATAAFGDLALGELRAEEICAWRGHAPRRSQIRSDPGAAPSPQRRGRV